MKHTLYLFSYLVMLPLAAAVFVIALFTGCVTIESVLKALLWLTRSTMTTETRNLAVVIAAAPLCPVFGVVGTGPHGLSTAPLFVLRQVFKIYRSAAGGRNRLR